MAKLIDAETVKEYLKRAIWGADRKIDKWVDVMPAVDAVPVVRCKHCKYRRDPLRCQMDSEGMPTPDDWYCADGERRDDDALSGR